MMKARDYNPAVKYGARWLPQDIAGMLGLPYVGNIYYVDPIAGVDAANDGTTQDAAFATVSAAFAKCTSGKHDVIVIAPTGGTGRATEVAPIVWNKRFTHLIGSCAPTMHSPRAGIEFSSAVTEDMIGITFSENGCVVKNVTITSTSDTDVITKVTGSYNYFGGCHLTGAQNATAGADTAWRALLVSAASENTFEGCTFGSETFVRSAANFNVEQTGTCKRNVYKDCFFDAYNTSADAAFFQAITGNCTEMFVMFDNCMMFAPVLVGASVSMDTAMNTSNVTNGIYIWKNSYFYGATALADVFTKVFCTTPVITGVASGHMVIASGT